MHVAVQALHDVRQRVHVRDVRLRAQEFRETLEVCQELRLADAARSRGRHRVLDGIQAEELLRLVGVGTELDALVEILDPLVVEIDRWYECDQRERSEAHADEQLAVVVDHDVRKALHDALGPVVTTRALRAIRQHADHCRQQRDRIQPRGGDTDGRDVAEVPVRRRVREVERQESDDRRQGRDRHRQEVDAYRFHERRGLVHPLTHQAAQRQQDVDRVGDRERQDDDRGGHRDGRQFDAGEAGRAHAHHRRQHDDDERRHRCREGADDQPGQREDDHEHQRHQRARVRHARLGERVVEHRDAGQVNLHVGEIGLDLRLQVSRERDGLRHFHQAFLRVLQHDVHRRDAGIGGHDLVAQQRFGQRHVAAIGEIVSALRGRVADQVLDDQVVLDRVGVLEVADRVDADRVRNLPGGLGELLDRGQRLGVECTSRTRLDDEEEIVVLRVRVLQVLERLQLGVGLGEEHPVVGGKLEPAGARADDDRQQNRTRDDQPAARDHGPCQRGRETIDCFEIRAHLFSPVK